MIFIVSIVYEMNNNVNGRKLIAKNDKCCSRSNDVWMAFLCHDKREGDKGLLSGFQYFLCWHYGDTIGKEVDLLIVYGLDGRR